jgi:abequosyltransferase
MTPRDPSNGAVWDDLTIAIPAYSRPLELRQLLSSISAMAVLPGEVLICEDRSPERQSISDIAFEWKSVLALKGCALQYTENPENLGYDGNVRNLFATATRPWVMLLGNDDAMLRDAVPAMQRFILANPEVQMISRSFVRFLEDVHDVIGITALSSYDRVYAKDNAEPGMILRLCGFVGGLLVKRQWAVSLTTEQYDGTLYYQIYLAAEAFSGTGIGYIAAPLVGSRAGNPPLFGSASAEKGTHVPGAYSPKARAAMWRGILRICTDVEHKTSVPLVRSIRRELSGRQSFHVFEMVSAQGRGATLNLMREFRRLGLTAHPLPWALCLLGLMLGRQARKFFAVVRNAQKWRVRRNRISEIGSRGHAE